MRALAAGVLVLFACDPSARGEPAAAPAASSLASRTTLARAPAGESLFEAPATVRVSPESVGLVSAPAEGRIVRILTRPGARVARGARIAQLLVPSVVRAAGGLVAARTRLEAYGRRRAQLERLGKDGLARLSDVAEVETRLAEARADEVVARSALRAAGLDEDTAPALVGGDGTVTLRSPIAGVVVEVTGAVGEVRDTSGPPIARVIGEGGRRIEARLVQEAPEGARFELETTAGQRVPLRLFARAPEVDARDGARLYWLEPASAASLTHGQRGTLRVLPLSAVGLVVVPASAVGAAGGRAFVLVRDGAVERRVDVEVLSSSGADALVRGELRVGQPIAADARGIRP